MTLLKSRISIKIEHMLNLMHMKCDAVLKAIVRQYKDNF